MGYQSVSKQDNTLTAGPWMFPRDCWLNLQLALISYRIFCVPFPASPRTVRFVSTGKPKILLLSTVTPFSPKVGVHACQWSLEEFQEPYVRSSLNSHLFPCVRGGPSTQSKGFIYTFKGFPIKAEKTIPQYKEFRPWPFPMGGKPHDRFFWNRSQIQQFRDFCCICMTHFIAMKKSKPILYSTWICLFDAWKKNHILSQMGCLMVMYHRKKANKNHQQYLHQISKLRVPVKWDIFRTVEVPL